MEKEYTFNGQRENEKVLSVIKNHPFILFTPGLKASVLLAIAIFILISWSGQFSGLLSTILILISVGILSRAIFVYTQGMFLLTSERVINVEQKGYLKRKITETEVQRIQDVSSEVSGFFCIILKYGNLIIRTAGAGQGSEIIVKNIPNPYSVQQQISHLK